MPELATNLLLTKLIVPPLRAVLERPHLLSQLSLGLDTTLTTVVGGAGYGKTTLLAQFAREQEAAAVWYRVEPDDADPVHFLRHLAHGLRERWGLKAAQLGSRLEGLYGAPGPEALAAALVADLLAGGAVPRLLILDDWHELPAGAPSQALLTRLVLAAPPNLHLYVASRTAPPLPLDRLRARGQLTELRQEDLCFRPEEAAALFRDVYRSRLTAAEVERLHGVTAGWATGLYLAHYARQQGDQGWLQRGADLAYRFFLGEVLERATAAERRLLLFASLVPCLDRAAGAALTGDPEAGETLKTLAAGHRFVQRLDDGTYQLHPLFREHLRRELHARHGEAEIAAAQARLAGRYAAAGQPDRAVPHLLAARCWQEAAAYLQAHLVRLGHQGQWGLLQEIAAQAPPPEQPEYPWWIMVQGKLAEARGELDAAAGTYRAAAGRFRADGNHVGATAAERARVMALLGGGQAGAALELLRELQQRTDPDALAWRPTLLSQLAQVLFRTGRPGEARLALEEALVTARVAGDRQLEARALNSMAMYVYCGCQDLHRARQSLVAAVAAVAPLNLPSIHTILQGNLGVTLAHLGDYPAALATLQDALHLAGEMHDAIAQARALEGLGLVHSFRGEFALGEEYLLRAWEVGQGIALRAQSVAQGLCNLYRRWGRPQDALNWGARAVALGAHVNLPYLMVSTLGEYALALLAAGRAAAAPAPLQQAEALAAAPGYAGDRLVLDLAWVRLLDGQDTPAAAAARQRWQAALATPENGAWLATERMAPARAAAAPPPATPTPAQADRPYRLTLLGAFRLERAGEPVALRPMVQKLLALLALRGERPMAREELAALMWPEAAPEAQLNSLRVALHQVRKAAPDLFTITAGTVCVRAAALRVDVTAFEQRLSDADRLWAGEDIDGAVRAYRAAATLYGGDLAPVPGQDSRAEHLRQRYVAALLRLARHAFATGTGAVAVELCERVLTADPYREDAYRLLMRVAAQSGGAREVTAAYNRLKGVLAELRLGPTAGTRRLLQRLLVGA